ncbi:MAG: hypothetical protein IKO72_08180 [Kiritimatiellae bacterium]|nr:hypothetical protein [Kiritimatiellia bacterium]
MKLSQKNLDRLRKIRRMLVSGKTLGGLLVGIAGTVTGCRDRGPHTVMGSYPADQGNVQRERRDCHVRGKYLVEPDTEKKEQQPDQKGEPKVEPKTEPPSKGS